MGSQRNLLYDVRKEKGLSHSHVASQLGVAITTVNKWELSLLRPSPRRIEQLAEFYQINKEDIENIIPLCSSPGCDRQEQQGGLCGYHYGLKYPRKIPIQENLEDAPTMGDRLHLLREKRQITLDTFANKFGVTVSTVEAWECNWIKPTMYMLMDIAGYYGVGTRLIERGVLDEDE